MSKDVLARLITLLAEVEAQLDPCSEPSLTELRDSLGAAQAALYRFTVEQRLDGVASALAPTRH